MLLADLQRVLDQAADAKQSYHEVIRLRGDGHWQSREAQAKLAEADAGRFGRRRSLGVPHTPSSRPQARKAGWRAGIARKNPLALGGPG